jgi:hypothetical protein
MPRPLRTVLVVATSGWLVSACGNIGTIGNIGLGSTQRPDFTKAQADMAGCRSAARSTGELSACSAKFGPALAQIAQDSYDQAGRAQDRATRINLFATAANAGWDSGTDTGLQVADAAIQAGGGECDKIPPNEFTPARDCALLSVGPGFVAHVRTAALVDRIAAKPRASVTAAERRQLNDASLRYVRNTFDFVESRRRQFDADPNLDASVRTLLDRQRAVFYCTALQISAVNRRLGQADTARRVSRDRDRILAAAPSLQGETCLATS